jgi:hypothetical protein
MIDVCPVCFKFLQTVLDKRKLKEIRLKDGQPCNSLYHKKLIG